MEKLRLAILDLYDNTPNQGMRCIKEIVARFDGELEWTVFDVRNKGEVPSLDYDIFISSGGPGDPRDGDGKWDKAYYNWLKECWNWNQQNPNSKKHVFFICHSFQMACRFFDVGKITRRKSPAFGTFRAHMTNEGKLDPLFQGLSNPFFVADFRKWQITQPDREKLDALGAKILALEKIRPHVNLERAIMGVRFSNEMVGVQFHPEADPEGLLQHFTDPERMKKIIEDHSEEKYKRMIDHLHDSDKIRLTYEIILPGFLQRAIGALCCLETIMT